MTGSGGPKPGADGVSRLELEEEMFSIRAMRHIFRLRANLSLQGWTTVLNPIMQHGYPGQYILTRDRPLLEPTFQRPRIDRLSLEGKEARSKGYGVMYQYGSELKMPPEQ